MFKNSFQYFKNIQNCEVHVASLSVDRSKLKRNEKYYEYKVSAARDHINENCKMNL